MSARLDRQTAYRRAAAPSVDFSLLPVTPEMAELLKEVANRPAPPPPPALVPQAAQPRIDKFHARARTPGGTLAPLDAPDAAAIRAPVVEAAAAAAFVQAHREVAPRRSSEAPTLRLDRRAVSPTIEPVAEAVAGPVTEDADLEAWVEADLAAPIADDQADEDVVDAWARQRAWRTVALALVGLLAVGALFVVGAVGLSAAAYSLTATEGPALTLEVPPAPTEVSRVIEVQRGDTLGRLLTGTDFDAKLIRAAARPARDLGKLEVGDRVELVTDATTGAPKAVRITGLDARTLEIRPEGAAWKAGWRGQAKVE